MEEKKKDRRSDLIIILLLLIIISLIGACWYAYSKYTTTLNGNSTTSVAKWNFGTTTTLTGVNLATTSAANGTLFNTVQNVVTNKIAPGTQGSFAVDLGTSGAEVAVRYTITLSNMVNKPTNLHFYSDSARTNQIDSGTSASVTGTIAQGDTGSTHKVTIYWAWPYETGSDAAAIASNDVTDTTDGIAANNMTFDITVNGTQVNPTDAQVTTSPDAVVTPAP